MTHQPTLSLTLAGSFCFAGLMFSGDLDTKSVQYKRWGWLRWIWWPYQQLLKHRSPLSHGVMLGTLFRLLYLSIGIGFFVMLFQLVGAYRHVSLQGQPLYGQALHAGEWLYTNPWYVWSCLLGLWLGGLSHTAADETSSWLKRRWPKRQQRKQKY